MNSTPLLDLIENKGFEQYQEGLESQFKAYKLEYKLVYCEFTNKTAMYMDFESEIQIGRITIWVSGECDMEVLDKSTGKRIFDEVHLFKSEQEFFEGYPRLVVYMREATKNDWVQSKINSNKSCSKFLVIVHSEIDRM